MIQKIVVTRAWTQEVEAELETLGEVRLNRLDDAFSRDDLAHAMTSADILCATVTDRIDADLLALPDRKVALIANFGVGFNHIDLEAARVAGVRVTNTPGVLTEATAEIALTLLLSVARRTNEGERLVRAGSWRGWYPTHMLSTQVTGKTLGIIGMGRIGLDLARKAHHGLGMSICYHNRSRLSETTEAELDAHYLPMDELLAGSDFVSLHCPATPETYHLINAERLALMSPQAFLINTARGDVVDERALAAALEAGELAGAGLDVYEAEPEIPAALLGLDNVVLLPHMGSGTVETRDAMGRCALANVRAFVEGRPLPNPVV